MTRAFSQYPTFWGSIGPKWFGLQPLQQHTTGIATATTMATAGRNGPQRPTWGCALHANASNGWVITPRASRYNFWVVEGVYGPWSAPMFWQWSTSLEGHTHPNYPKNNTRLLGGCHPSIQRVNAKHKSSCGALGGHFCWQRPQLAMAVLVVVGHWNWRLLSDQHILFREVIYFIRT